MYHTDPFSIHICHIMADKQKSQRMFIVIEFLVKDQLELDSPELD